MRHVHWQRCASGVIGFWLLGLAGVMAGEAEFRGALGDVPAKEWKSAFVSGNGRLGAMVFGDPTNETIVANHCRLFVPLGNREIVPDLAKTVPDLQKVYKMKGAGPTLALLLEKAKEEGYPGLIPTDPYHPGFFVNIIQKPEGAVTDYTRTENFQNGEVTVAWKDARGPFQRKLFVSRRDNVIVLSITGPSAGAVDCDLVFPAVNHKLVETTQETTVGWVNYHNVYKKGKGGFDSVVRISLKGGRSSVKDRTVAVKGADEVVLLMQVVPWKTPLSKDLSEAWSYSPDHPDFAKTALGKYKPAPALAESSVVAYTEAEAAKALVPLVRDYLGTLSVDYATLMSPHAKIHGELFNRVKLDLGGGVERGQTTDALLDMADKEKRLPAALMEKMYDAGRYMFICSAGELLPNLQGIWTGSWSPNWSGDFTLDTNVQAAMASACSANLPDLMEGYFQTMESFYPEWRLNARRIYGCRGVLCNARASNTCLMLHWGRWPGVFWTAGTGWLASFFADYYFYTGDREFLATRCVPLLKEVALFYEDFLAGTGTGDKVEFFPSYNPETGCGFSATMDIAVAREVLGNLIAFSRELKVESESIPRWEVLLAKLPSYPNNDGALTEWQSKRPVDGKHRHASQLYPCFQSFDTIFETDSSLRKAAQATVRLKIAGSDGGGEQSSFGRIQCGVSAAYLGMAEEAYGRLKVMAVKRSMNPSLITSHEPHADIFNADANGGIPQIVNMMLVFSRPGRLDLLPALPAEWPTGTIQGILARGGITIHRLSWDKPAGRLDLELVSNRSQTLTLRLPAAETIKAVTVTGGKIGASAGGQNARELTLEKGSAAVLHVEF
jgi:alpha-L-fucosidase 2